MAKNIKVGNGTNRVPNMAMAVTSPTTNTSTGVPASGDPCAAGRIPGIAENDVDVDSALTVINTDCIAEIPVVGTDNAGNSAVSAGDLLYISSAGVVSKDSVTSGQVKFGTAFGKADDPSILTPTRSGTLVSAGATTTIQVWVGKIN